MLLGFSLPENFFVGGFGTIVFGVIGIVLLLLGFKLFDWLLPRLNFEDELKGNPIAIAIVIGAFFVSLALIIGHVVA